MTVQTDEQIGDEWLRIGWQAIRYGWLRANMTRFGNEWMTASRVRELTGEDVDRMVDEWMSGIK